jgi:multidrug transporter EmrE-like cation transporter
MRSEAGYTLLQSPVHSNDWAKAAVNSLLFFAAGTYFCGLTSSDPVATRTLASLGTLICAVGLVMYAMTFEKRSSPLEETLLDSCKEVSLKEQMRLCSIAGLLNCLGFFALFMGYYYDPTAIGVTTSVVLGTGLTSAGLSYYLYDERLSQAQLTGMGVVTTGLILLALQNSSEGTFPAFLSGFAALAFFTCRELMSRSFERKGLDQKVTSIISLFSEGMFGLYLGVFLTVFGSGLTLSGWEGVLAVAGGVFNALGTYYLNKGIMTGFTGSTVCISNMASLLMVGMQLLHAGSVLSVLRSFGMLVCLVGVSVLFLSESFLARLGLKTKAAKSL